VRNTSRPSSLLSFPFPPPPPPPVLPLQLFFFKPKDFFRFHSPHHQTNQMGRESKKRKRGRKPKIPSAETVDLPTTSTTAFNDVAFDDVFSVTNVELIEPPASNRRGRPNQPRRATPERALENGDFVDVTVGAVEFAGAAARVVPAMDAVVKVFCVHTEPNFSLPWQRKRQYSSSSSGFVIGGRRVLTNAHSVEHYTQVKLKKRGSDTKYLATVLAIGTECDIGR
jgi:hypothetical protein